MEQLVYQKCQTWESTTVYPFFKRTPQLQQQNFLGILVMWLPETLAEMTF